MAQAHGQCNLRYRGQANDLSQQWTVSLSREWDVLGPFPIHAREQQFLSPSYPINLSEPIDFKRTWPSSYADNAIVGWSKTQLSEDGVITVAFPDIRWESLRATEGWAAVQHHAVLRGTMTLTPPGLTDNSVAPPRILIQLKQGSYLAILPAGGTERAHLVPEWYAGNIYDMERALPRVVNLPTMPDHTNPTEYDIFISGDYEIRLFGDPHHFNTSLPTQVIGLSVQVDTLGTFLLHEPTQDVVCDFVDGFSFGETIGIGLRTTGWSTVTQIISNNPEVQLKLKQRTRIAPSQLRIVPLLISQHQAFHGTSLDLTVTVKDDSGQLLQIPLTLPVVQRSSMDAQKHMAFKATYLFGGTMPTAFTAIPPVGTPRSSSPPILALHGAGVDIINQTFWAEALPPSKNSWTVIPSGRTSWGLDWHGPSALDAWGCIDALADILERSSEWKDTAFKAGTPVVIIGHSNGGQGTWYIGLRYPDRVLGLVPAAGYIKSQAYVPLTMSRSAHFIDPLLRAILETSLTPDDDDLFLTNIVNKPVLVVHGGDDDNVPVWHGRESFSVVKSWARIHGVDPDITMKEDKGELHFYPTVLNDSQVQAFVDSLLAGTPSESKVQIFRPFTLTVFRPEESGSLNGWKIEQVAVPGRLARLTVTPSGSTDSIKVHAVNVKAFSVSQLPGSISVLQINGDDIPLKKGNREPLLHFQRDTSAYKWTALDMDSKQLIPSPPTRLQFFLSTTEPLTFIQPDIPQNEAQNFKSLAFRLAHDLHIYHRLDSKIVEEHEVFAGEEPSWPKGNVVLIGRLKGNLIQHILRQGKTPIKLAEEVVTLNGHPIRTDSDTGLIFLHPHPTSADALLMLILAESSEALERVGRLFPIRTGVPVPSWVILGPTMEGLGAAGINAAG